MQKIGLMIILSLMTQTAFADLPLKIEDLITDQGKYKVDFSLRYSNNEDQYSNALVNSDVVISTIGVRYGINPKLETYARASYVNNDTRLSDASGILTQSDADFNSAWLGLNYQFSEDNDTPAMLGYIEGALLEKRNDSTSSAKSWVVGLSTYRALDPIVLTLSTAYGFNQVRKEGLLDYKPGNYLSLSPSVGFAVNDSITLTTGFSWLNRWADETSNTIQGARTTSTSLNLGLGYSPSE